MKNYLKQIRILIVEDNEIQRSELSKFFKRRVKKVYLAKDGKQGLKKYKELKPDIIITDLRMPKMTGLELLENVRQEDRITQVIIVTALNDKNMILESVEKGIANYVVKPIDMEELLSIVNNSIKTLLKINKDRFNTVIQPKNVNCLKQELSKYIKDITGKGPKDIRIEFKDGMCFINFIDILTTYEKKLIEYNKNLSLVNHNRNILIKDRRTHFENKLREIFSIEPEFISVKTDASNNSFLVIIGIK